VGTLGALIIWLACAQAGEAERDKAEQLALRGIELEEQTKYAGAGKNYAKAVALLDAEDGDLREFDWVYQRYGWLLYQYSRNEEARAPMERAVELSRLRNDPDGLSTSVNNLGLLYVRLGDLEGALELIQEGLQLAEATHGPNDPETAASVAGLAHVYTKLGDYARARPLHERNLRILEDVVGEDHPEYAKALGNFAALLKQQGDLEGSIPLQQKALEIMRATAGDRHPVVIQLMQTIGETMFTSSKVEMARSMVEESLVLAEHLPARHPAHANGLALLASIEIGDGDYEAALALMVEVVERARKGKNPAELAMRLGSMGFTLKEMGRYQEANGYLLEALELYRPIVGDTLETGRLLQWLGFVAHHDDRHEQASDYYGQAIDIALSRLELLDALSEREAFAFVTTLQSLLFDSMLYLNTTDVEASWNLSNQLRGVVASQTRATHLVASMEPAAAEAATELAEVRKRLAHLAMAGGQVDRLALNTRKEELERSLSAQSAQYRDAILAAGASPRALCEALPDGFALADYSYYRDLKDWRYQVYVARAGRCDDLRVVELGRAVAVHDALGEWRDVLDQPDSPASRIDRRGEVVRDLIWTPVEDLMEGVDHVLVVPDGGLTRTPLAALPTADETYLIESHSITYLDHARDVLRDARSLSDGGALAVGSVDYAVVDSSDGEADLRSPLATCTGGGFEPLPGTALEIEDFAERWRKVNKSDPLTLTGTGASEPAVVEALQGKAIVHIATHGYFATDECREAMPTVLNPMARSGLVLAGANNPADPAAASDGILTAEEVAALDLSGTNLVVLSACETGLGHIVAGEGVMGLRRSFAIAGVQTVIMSLWSIPDQATSALMAGMYEHLLKRRGSSPSESLRQAQLGILAEQREAGAVWPQAWAAFVVSGDWR